MEDSEHVDFNSNEFNLIDFSSETDNLLFSTSPIHHQHKFTDCQSNSTVFETVGDVDSGNSSQGNDQHEQVPELAQSEEPQRIRSGKCHLRKSLAWDDAFFTSAGVLDPEELTSMMDGPKAQKQFLPKIQEDMQRSTDSISTLESDNFSLESFEVDLFKDIRASIQKSSITAKGSFGKKEIRKEGDQDISSSNWGSISQNQLKSKPVTKKVTGVHKSGVPKCQPKVNTAIQGSTKAVKPESGRSVIPASAVRNGASTSSLAKPLKRTSKPSSTTPSGTKVTSLVPSHLKTESINAKTVAGRGSHAPKMSSSDSSCRILPKAGTTSKSSSRESSMAKTQSTRSSAKGPKCDSQLSEDVIKSSLATLRKKAPSKAVNSPSPCATPQSSSKKALKNKTTSENSTLAAYMMSSKVLSCISPASSVSEWSSASSSSAVNQKSNKSRSSFGSSSCISVDGDALQLNIEAHANNQIRRRQEIKRSAEILNKPSLQAEVVPASSSTSTKPTGLRMPSPKIGFFDGVKSVRASSGAQPRAMLPVALPNVRPGVSPRGISNIKHKAGKLPPGRVLTARKHDTKNTDVPLPAQGNREVTPCNGDHETKMVDSPLKVLENGSGEHDEVSSKGNFGVNKHEMMLGVDQDFGLKDVEAAPEHDSKADSCRSATNECERLDASKTNASSKDEDGVQSGPVNLQSIEPLPVTCSEAFFIVSFSDIVSE